MIESGSQMLDNLGSEDAPLNRKPVPHNEPMDIIGLVGIRLGIAQKPA